MRMSRPHDGIWAGTALCVALGLAAAAMLAAGGDGEARIEGALFATGRLAFVLFFPAYAGGALASLFGPAFAVFRRHGREFGLAFAAVIVVHLGLIAALCVVGDAPSLHTFLFFGLGAAFVLSLALFSLGALHRALGPLGWWLLRAAGLNYIAYVFAVDFLKRPFGGGVSHVVLYLPFAALAVAGPLLRAAAFVQRVAGARRRIAYRPG